MSMEWFESAKLGIFNHWGIYAVQGTSESWEFAAGGMSHKDYMKQLNGFTAKNYNPEAWAELFKKAGAKYAVLTAKHCDGVALFDTKYGDLNVVKSTPAGRDLIGPYCKAMREGGLKTGLYFTHTDWSVDEMMSVVCDMTLDEVRAARTQKFLFSKRWNDVMARPIEEIDQSPERKQSWKKFMTFYFNQLSEVVNNFGPIDVLWGDAMYEVKGYDWRKDKIRDLIKKANPDTIISRLPGFDDIATPEVRAVCSRPSKRPWEYCTPINGCWGYRPGNTNYKSYIQVIRIFCDVIAMGGNLLLDVGPLEDGSIDQRQEEVLLKLGKFIKTNEEAIYETRQGLDWRFYNQGSVLSKDGKTLYLFVHDIPRDGIMLKGVDTPYKRATVLSTGQELEIQKFFNGNYGCYWLHLKPEMVDPDMPVVVKFEFEEPCVAVDKWGILWENEKKV